MNIAEIIVRSSRDHLIVIGPLVFAPSDGMQSKIWYFTVAVCDHDGFFLHKVIMPNGATDNENEISRRGFMVELAQRQGIIIHGFDDELQMAKFCESAWPGQQITKLREQIEAEQVNAKR
jgi:hypothetical protein